MYMLYITDAGEQRHHTYKQYYYMTHATMTHIPIVEKKDLLGTERSQFLLQATERILILPAPKPLGIAYCK